MKTKKIISVLCSVCGGTDKKHNKLFSGLECPMKKRQSSDKHTGLI